MSGAVAPSVPARTERARGAWASGVLGGRQRRQDDALARFIEAGRGAFELSLALCALSLAFPWLAVGAIAASARSWHQGSRRAWRAFIAAAWCCFLGLAVRAYLGFGVFP